MTTGEIRAYQPTVWNRIRHVFTEGIPRYSSRTVYDPKYGQAQLLSPEEALTPGEQARHPILTGAGEFAEQTPTSLSTRHTPVCIRSRTVRKICGS